MKVTTRKSGNYLFPNDDTTRYALESYNAKNDKKLESEEKKNK